MLDEKYRLDSRLGEGGMGVVYRATHLGIDRPVAIKVLRTEYTSTEELLERFLREAKSAARVRDEHVVEILDFGRSSAGELFFVMELLEGHPLSSFLKHEHHFSPRRAAHVAVQICQALHAAHAHGIIHRDLKAANVVLTRRGNDDSFVKVLDFGVAKLVGEIDAQLTRSGMLVGTVECMAPEQVTGKPVDARTDVYALGVLLFRMLTGRSPFVGENVAAIVYHHVNTPAESVRTLVGDSIPEALDRVVARCLEKDAAKRFPSMAAAAQALVDAVTDLPSEPSFRPQHFPSLGPGGDAISWPTPPPLPAPREMPTTPPRPVQEVTAKWTAKDGARGAAAPGRTPTPGTPGKRSQKTRIVLGVGAVVVVGTLIAALSGGGEEPKAKAAALERPPAVTKPHAEPKAEPVKLAAKPKAPAVPGAVEITSTPSSAKLFIDGKEVGVGRIAHRPEAFKAFVLRVEADGFVPLVTELVPTEAGFSFRAELRKESPPARAQARKSAPPTRSAKRSSHSRTAPDSPAAPPASELEFLPLDL